MAGFIRALSPEQHSPALTKHNPLLAGLVLLLIAPLPVYADELWLDKTCPVLQPEAEHPLGLLAFSRPWYHSGRSQAAYIASDNATGVGVEIHFFSSARGDTRGINQARCDRYRLLQIRATNARLFDYEKAVQVDVPQQALLPFYDAEPLEHGYGTHLTPADTQDKPWQHRPVRASTVAIYDTPYVSDAYGTEGEPLITEFETCVVCERDNGYDSLLSCGRWGFQRDYLNQETGWTEPEFIPVDCRSRPSEQFVSALKAEQRLAYDYWFDWR